MAILARCTACPCLQAEAFPAAMRPKTAICAQIVNLLHMVSFHILAVDAKTQRSAGSFPILQSWDFGLR